MTASVAEQKTADHGVVLLRSVLLGSGVTVSLNASIRGRNEVADIKSLRSASEAAGR